MSHPRYARHRQKKKRTRCPFCDRKIGKPTLQLQVYTGDGCLGGHCECGAAYAVDETGRLGGQTLLDALALFCDGDLDRALALDSEKDYRLEKRPWLGSGQTAGRMFRHGLQQPKVWFVAGPQE